MGYNTVNLGLQYTMIGPCFNAVGQNGLARVYLKDLVGDFEDEDEIQISYMDGKKIRFDSYIYCTTDGAYGVDVEGWYLDGEEWAGEVYLDQGHAAWLKSSGSSTQAGEVKKASITINNLTKAYEMLLNPFPVAFNPNDSEAVTFTGISDEDEIQVSYMDGKKIRFNSYIFCTTDGAYGVDVEGWYLDGEEYVEAPIAQPGQGWWLKTADPTGVSIEFTSPIK